jgi:hypothetical protein
MQTHVASPRATTTPVDRTQLTEDERRFFDNISCVPPPYPKNSVGPRAELLRHDSPGRSACGRGEWI